MTFRKVEMRGVALLIGAFCTVHCGDDDAGDTGGGAGSGPVAGSGARPVAGSSGAGAGAPSSEDIPTLNGCAEAAYADRSTDDDPRTVDIAGAGLVFTPRCMLIAAGQIVTFEGSLAAHPLAPGNASDDFAGSPDSPIEPTSSGRSVTFTFPTPGTYPYFCELHGFGTGSGMSGAIHVR